MKHRKLRIAWSVVWGVVAVLLVVLWVRSAGRLDIVCYRTTTPPTFHLSALPRTFGLRPSLGKILVRFPIWFLILVASTFAAVPCFHWRFSLRTLLIATTLVAIVLGLIVWLR